MASKRVASLGTRATAFFLLSSTNDPTIVEAPNTSRVWNFVAHRSRRVGKIYRSNLSANEFPSTAFKSYYTYSMAVVSQPRFQFLDLLDFRFRGNFSTQRAWHPSLLLDLRLPASSSHPLLPVPPSFCLPSRCLSRRFPARPLTLGHLDPPPVTSLS